MGNVLHTNHHGWHQKPVDFLDNPGFHVWLNGLRVVAHKTDGHVLASRVRPRGCFETCTFVVEINARHGLPVSVLKLRGLGYETKHKT